MEHTQPRMSFREQSIWASLVTTVVIYGGLLLISFRGGFDLGTVQATQAFVAAVALQAAAMMVIQIIAAIRTRPERKDERDLSIESRSFRYAYIALAACVMSVVCVVWWWPGQTPFQRPLYLGHLFYLSFVIAEAIRFATQVILYRREA